MIKRMEGNRKEWEYPVSESEGEIEVTDKDKAEMLVKATESLERSYNNSYQEVWKRPFKTF